MACGQPVRSAVSWTQALGKDGDYVLFAPGWHASLQYPGVAQLNSKYQSKLGRDTDVTAGPAYACVQIVANAVERAGRVDAAPGHPRVPMSDTARGHVLAIEPTTSPFLDVVVPLVRRFLRQRRVRLVPRVLA